MTLETQIDQLRAQLEAKNQLIADQAKTIAQFGAQATRYAELESRCLDQAQEIATLNERLLKAQPPDVWDSLTEGWMNSAIGKRALLTPGVDLTGFEMGVNRQNFKLIQSAYKQVLEMLALAGVPATVTEQQEIGVLLKTLGFA